MDPISHPFKLETEENEVCSICENPEIHYTKNYTWKQSLEDEWGQYNLLYFKKLLYCKECFYEYGGQYLETQQKEN